MTQIEKLLTQVGELVATEIDEVKSVTYPDAEQTAFEITMNDGKKYIVQIKEPH